MSALQSRTGKDVSNNNESASGNDTSPQGTGRQISKADSEIDGAAGSAPAVYLDGIHRLVTPCHVYEVGLRASKICERCGGNLSKPVETAMMLPCNHWTVVSHPTGDRRKTCDVCGVISIVRAETVLHTKYSARPLVQAETLTLFE